jgi:hypothetical protein
VRIFILFDRDHGACICHFGSAVHFFGLMWSFRMTSCQTTYYRKCKFRQNVERQITEFSIYLLTYSTNITYRFQSRFKSRNLALLVIASAPEQNIAIHMYIHWDNVV